MDTVIVDNLADAIVAINTAVDAVILMANVLVFGVGATFGLLAWLVMQSNASRHTEGF